MLTPWDIVLVLALLQTKHLIMDWLWQPEYEWRNKGTLGHWGGIRHSIKHALGTGACFAVVTTVWPVMVAMVIEFVVHYAVDWCKMNINRVQGWGPLTHAQFWWLTGADQYAHQITYVLLILMML